MVQWVITFLGGTIYEDLTWKQHINSVCLSTTRLCGNTFKDQIHLSKETLILIDLAYCFHNGGNLCGVYLKKRLLGHINIGENYVLQIRILSSKH